MLVSGLLATGKSTLGGLLADRIGAVTLSRDLAVAQMDGLLAGFDRLAAQLRGRRRRPFQERADRWLVGAVGVALGAGRTVVVEVVADADLRRWLEALAQHHRAQFFAVEMVCSDRDEHLRRLRGRFVRWERALRGLPHSYKPAPGALTLDSAKASAELLEPTADLARRLTPSSEA